MGMIQVAIDSGVLIGLSALGLSIPLANIAGRLSGASAGFVLNGTTTFSAQTNQPLHGKPLMRFITTWIILTIVSTSMLYAIRLYVPLEKVWLSKPLVEIFLATISFFASKFWIYK
jgi:putative flippase GtrA